MQYFCDPRIFNQHGSDTIKSPELKGSTINTMIATLDELLSNPLKQNHVAVDSVGAVVSPINYVLAVRNFAPLRKNVTKRCQWLPLLRR